MKDPRRKLINKEKKGLEVEAILEKRKIVWKNVNIILTLLIGAIGEMGKS